MSAIIKSFVPAIVKSTSAQSTNQTVDVKVVEESTTKSASPNEQGVCLIFYVSRYIPTKRQLRLGEYLSEETVKALATWHFKDGFLSGLPPYIRSENGELRAHEKKPGTTFTWEVNLPEGVLAKVQAQVEKLGETLTKPSKDEGGKSLLRGYQLQVHLHPGAYVNPQTEINGWGTKIVVKINASEVSHASIIKSSSPDWIAIGNRVSADTAVKYLCTQVVGGTTIDTVEGLKEFLGSQKPKDKRSPGDRLRQRGVKVKNGQQPPANEEQQGGTTIPLDEELDG